MKHTSTSRFLRRAIAVVAFAALAVPVTIAYQHNPPVQAKAEFPASAEGKLARALLDAINSGDKSAIESFVKGNLSVGGGVAAHDLAARPAISGGRRFR